MVKPDVADDRGLRRGNDVCRIQLAAKPDLQRHDVAFVPLEILHGNDRDQLKLRRMVLHRFCVRADKLGNFGQLFIGDHLAVDLHPLVEAENEGRGVKAGAVSRRAEHGSQHGGGRTLAISTGDVDEFQLVPGTEPFQQTEWM